MNDAECILSIWGSGFVNRWHTHPDPRLRNAQDTTAAHSQRVAVLYAMLTTEYVQCTWDKLMDALLHDAPEVATGDLSYGFKRRNPAVRDMFDEFDDAWFKESGFTRAPEMTPLLKLCDHLDSVLFVKRHAPDVLEGGGWPDQITLDLELAETLGIRPVVWGLIYARL